MGKIFTIHANAGLEHQLELARCLRDGFRKHGINSLITNSPNTLGDVHVVLGPWFAFQKWRYADTLYIDRAYWGDPDCVSVHWLECGEKVFSRNNPDRLHPAPKPWKSGNRTIYLCDYDKEPEGNYHSVRKHPAGGGTGLLADDLAGHDIAIGRRTTALVDAAIDGLMVVTDDRHSPVWPIQGRRGSRKQWLNDLAWHNWSKTEIQSGEMWNELGTGYTPH